MEQQAESSAFQKEIDDQLPVENRKELIKIEASITKLNIKLQNVAPFEIKASEPVHRVHDKIIQSIQSSIRNVNEAVLKEATIFIKDSYIPSPFEKIGDLYSIFGDKEKKSIRLTLSEKSYQA